MRLHFQPILFFFLFFLSVEKPLSAQNSENLWAEKQLQNMSLDEKIGQLFMVAAYSNKGIEHQNALERLIKDQKIGGLIFFQGTPSKQAQLCNRYQSLSKTPLLISIDGEWGLSMRLDSTVQFPRQLTLGAIQNNFLIEKMGEAIGEHCQRLGIHFNLAPVVDVNNNPNNPVINDRSFGENKYKVAEKSIAYMRGMERKNVLACAKHFPGHGDTDKDSHKTLPIILHDIERLNDVELYPFRALVEAGVAGIMSAHLSVPALDNKSLDAKDADAPSIPASLSSKMVDDLLKKQMGYQGLVFTDALNMKGVADYFSPGDVDLRAFLAGNDVLLFPENVPSAARKIKEAIDIGTIEIAELDRRVLKLLKTKKRVGLDNYQAINPKNLTKDLNEASNTVLNYELYSNALTLARDEQQLVPVIELENKRFASLSIGGNSTKTEFQHILSKYAQVNHFHLSKSQCTTAELDKMLAKLAGYDQVFVSLHGMSRYAKKEFGVPAKVPFFIECLQEISPTVTVLFGSPYSLVKFDGVTSIMLAYEENDISQSVAAQALFAARAITGQLPISASAVYREGMGIATEGGKRLQYGLPEGVGIATDSLLKIERIIAEALKGKATPGCQVLVAKNGQIIFEKSYGHHTDKKNRKVRNSDLYDLASITKVAASLPMMMKLYDRDVVSAKTQLGELLPSLKNTNKSKLQIADILCHQARLQSWIPFYSKEKYKTAFVTKGSKADTRLVEVGKNYFMKKNYIDTMFNDILTSDLRKSAGYKYSDLGYYLMQKVIEEQFNQPLDEIVQAEYLKSLGMNMTTYNPLKKFSKSVIVPTEKDDYFRNQLLQGHVHDMGAAMMGGVGGHAGLFSNANDLAKLMQLFLNDGEYGGSRYFSAGTVKYFASQYSSGNRRGIGFDKPEPNTYNTSPCGENTPLSTFGHTGFTGTCMWADPDNELIYIFLSNRVFPKMNNRTLISENIRTRIQEEIYKSLNTYPISESSKLNP